MQVAVLGSGSWGTALAMLLGRNHHPVTLYGRSPEEIDDIRTHRENRRYLPGHHLPPNVEAELLRPVENCDIVVVAVPASGVAEVVPEVQGRPIVVIATKGLDPDSGQPLHHLVRRFVGDAPIVALSGPNLAVEIAQEVPTVAISASHDQVAAEAVRDLFGTLTFRVSTSADITGVELAGALKNVLAIGAGMSDGLGFGDNTKGAFLSRGLLEMNRLGAAMGAESETFLGPAGVGDLFATAASKLSRNYRLGYSLGQGTDLATALQQLGQVAEGEPTSRVALTLAQAHGVQLPVFAAVAAVIQGRIRPLDAVSLLMDRRSSSQSFS